MLLYGLSDVGLIGCIWCNWHYYYLTEKSQLLFQNFWSSSEMVWFISYTEFSESCHRWKPVKWSGFAFWCTTSLGTWTSVILPFWNQLVKSGVNMCFFRFLYAFLLLCRRHIDLPCYKTQWYLWWLEVSIRDLLD